ncbi:hypothetical protein P4O66_004744 [Electrophorus voltai]|uniref:Uncharacterized protein n=1 Tax=Electrophorus voltai TaxID=2609070 RepID=A0AAD8ZKE3_9TELE|nr:hypothetical protein P4O66_004744 [Electrophorus voltai]
MEVEEALHEDSMSMMDVWSADSDSDDPPAPKALPKARCTRISKLPHVTHKEVVSSSLTWGTCVPAHKLQGGKKEVSPVPAPKTGKTTGALLKTYAPKPEKPPPPNSAKGEPPQQILVPLKVSSSCSREFFLATVALGLLTGGLDMDI